MTNEEKIEKLQVEIESLNLTVQAQEVRIDVIESELRTVKALLSP